MATEIRVNLTANTEQAETNLNDVVNILGKINDNLEENKKAVQDLGKETENNTTSVNKLSKGFRGVGLALKGMGIGFALKAFNGLASVIEENQKFADGLAKVFRTISIVVGELLNTLEPLVDVFINVGSAIKALITRDFDRLSEIGFNLQNSFKQLGNNVVNFTTNLSDTVIAASEVSDELVKLQNETELAAAKAEQLVFIYQTEAEQLRQLRDDTRKTVRERIAANEELGQVLDKQFNAELSLRQKRLELVQRELELNPQSIAAQKAVIEAETELLDVRERITGQRSEFLTNQAALEQELIEANEEIKNITTTSFQDITNAKRRETDAIVAANMKQLNSKKIQIDKTEKLEQEQFARRKQREEELKQVQQLTVAAGLQAVQNGLGAISQLYEGNTRAQKNIQIAQATISTFQGALNAFQAAQIIPPPAGQIIGATNAGAAIAAGFAQIRNIKKTNISANSAPRGGGGGGSFGSAGASFTPFQPTSPTISALPQFSNIGLPNQNQQNQNIRAYVVSNEITDAQALDKRLNQRSTL